MSGKVPFNDKLGQLILRDRNFICFRHPGEEEPGLVVDKGGRKKERHFVFHPFRAGEKKTVTIGMGRDNVFSGHMLPDFPVENFPEYPFKLPQPPVAGRLVKEEDYLRLVEKARETIAGWEDEGKIVTSRVAYYPSGRFEAVQGFEKLCTAYPDAFVYLLMHRDAGVWIGATPEILLRTENEKVCSMSLAGTLPAEKPKWKKKERVEQHYVTRFLEEEYIRAGIGNIRTSGPETVNAGPVAHLRSWVCGEMPGDFDPGDFAGILHPTPAVCGIPRKQALEFVEAEENYSRDYFTGFMGFREKKRSRYYVNLRCMQLFKHHAALYAGGGVTRASNPLKEWKETQQKMQVLRNVLFTENPEHDSIE